MDAKRAAPDAGSDASSKRLRPGKPESKGVRENYFKAAIKPGPGQRRQIGLWTGLRSSLVAEMLSTISGMDWFVIDMEHGPNEIVDVLTQLQASQYGHAEPIIRVPWNEPVIVKRVLDLGAQSILFPYVNTAEEARQAVAATRYPPEGVRGVMSLARMNNYGAANPHYYREAASQICTIVQVETTQAVANIEEIAAVDGVDALFVGPSDLAASMGHIGNPNHPEVKEKIDEAFRRISATGKASGFLSADHEACRRVLKAGCTFVAVGGDMQMLSKAVSTAATEFHEFAKQL
mmetsp:Transcript_35374/g.82714  ORF Transcript_35374/g.82714 Transcript_35374/m.82714 type:complete len:291 (+) Transcript_35374:82-954(+)